MRIRGIQKTIRTESSGRSTLGNQAENKPQSAKGTKIEMMYSQRFTSLFLCIAQLIHINLVSLKWG